MTLSKVVLQTALLYSSICVGLAQTSPGALDAFPIEASEFRIAQSVRPNHPFTVAGEAGAILGWQDGRFEFWSLPVKLLENFHIVVELADYPVSIDVNRQAATIEVDPDHTTITYSHAAFTLKQHMFAPRGDASREAGAIVLFEMDMTLPAVLHFRFGPTLVPQWPAPQFGRPDTSWLESDPGGYVLASSDPRFYGLVTMPGARKLKQSPYDEWPSTEPTEFTVDFDPKRDHGKVFPLIAFSVSGGEDLSTKVREALGARAARIRERIPQLYAATRQYYARFFDNKVMVETSDPRFNLALRWAQFAIDQSQVRHRDETGLVAGWYSSGSTGRPGFGWFFGRDTLWSLYAIHSYGDFSLARHALDFLIKRQRADGKIMHEFSQTADMVDWARLPYWYAAADSTPLFIMAMEDYVRTSGDLKYLKDHWTSVQRAYTFSRQHDSDGDGIYDNKEGTGWVESWKPKLPNQELYLAALDQQAAESYSRMAGLLDDAASSAAASKAASDIKMRLAGYRSDDGSYAFSRNADGSFDRTRTIFPTVAWWSGRLSLPQPEAALRSWASHEFATDWGARSLSPADSFYDPLTYHQGTVWPLFTGWSAMAQYRSGRSLAGYSQLMSNLQLTYAYDLGATTEILSGRFFASMPRGSSHQLWSSAMTFAVAMRGLFGLEVDAVHKRLHLAPRLPGNWDRAEINNIPFGEQRLRITMKRQKRHLDAVAKLDRPESLCIDTAGLVDLPCQSPPALEARAQIVLPPVEIVIPPEIPAPGAESKGVRVMEERLLADRLTLTLESPAGSTRQMQLRLNELDPATLRVSGATLRKDMLEVSFPAGTGYTTQQVEIRWK